MTLIMDHWCCVVSSTAVQNGRLTPDAVETGWLWRNPTVNTKCNVKLHC